MSVFIFIIAIVILLSAHQSNLCLKLQSFYLWMVIMVIKVIMVIIVIVVIMDIIVIMAIMVKDICHHGPTGRKILATWLSHFLALDC